ncbi:hypothetical protein K2173_023196 [Erythroxylum novogranatense]|uniref:Sec16 Sec23-binding domain-containing protein n=1 Tax=Erythroxylum novogranatense TaxID=1862640 RepID=A0AAV8U802_9ROSI|nr:hypothetical protein K2173_023196 [Erythroxylum novogranatense]
MFVSNADLKVDFPLIFFFKANLCSCKLFASAKRSGSQFSGYGVLSHCLQNLPSEGQLRATASEVQSLLVSGRKKEALQCAQKGQLWGSALVLASQLGDQFYVDTVKQMAAHQLVSGSPLRTLCLLIAGTPADAFAVDSIVGSVIPGAVHMTPQSVQGLLVVSLLVEVGR